MPIEFKTPPYEHMPQTPEEAEAYRENYLTGMRSGIRGPVQGIASLTGMGDVPALLELGAYEQAGLPAYERGLIDYEDIPRAGYGETRQKHLETIGEAYVPGETIEPGVQGSQLLTELAGIGVIGKQAIDLIRKYGPLAVTKIKSIFAKKSGATVDDAVKEALEVSRRDVLKAGGAGIAALALPTAAWKLGTAATKAAPVASTAATKFAKLIASEDLVKSTQVPIRDFIYSSRSSPIDTGKWKGVLDETNYNKGTSALIDKKWKFTKDGDEVKKIISDRDKRMAQGEEGWAQQEDVYYAVENAVDRKLPRTEVDMYSFQEAAFDPIFLQRVGKDLFGKYGLEPSDITILSEEFGATGRGYYSNPMTGQVFKSKGDAKNVAFSKGSYSGMKDAVASGYYRLFDFNDEILNSAKLKEIGRNIPDEISGIDFDFKNVRYLDYEGIPIVEFKMENTWSSGKLRFLETGTERATHVPSKRRNLLRKRNIFLHKIMLVPNANGLSKLTGGKTTAEKLVKESVNVVEKIKKAHGGFIDKAITGGSKDI